MTFSFVYCSLARNGATASVGWTSEAMHMIRKGQARRVSDDDVRKQNQFIDQLFDLAA
jgi:hypothetical protein